MKKSLYLAVCLVAVAALGSCNNKKAATTAGEAAKQYADYLKNDKYDAFVEAIVFTEPVAPAAKPAVQKAVKSEHAKQLRTVHHPNVTERGGVKEIRIVSETPSADSTSYHVVLTNHYNNGIVETMNYHMVNDNNIWKIRETPYKEIWKATIGDGHVETIKIRSGHDRDFIKEKDNGEKQFVKDIIKRDGQVEIIKTLQNGERHREVIKHLDEGNREIDKLKIDSDKDILKEIDRVNREILKEKGNVDGDLVRTREVIRK